MEHTQSLPTVSAEDLGRQLAEPFDPRVLKMKPQVVQGSRALAVFYVDARAVQDRLDDVLGTAGWSTHFTPLPNGSVMCELSCKFDGAWITKGDVGAPSEQPDAGDRTKAAFSDGLKRAAVHFGVGRYIYNLGGQWLAYDAATKRITGTPKLAAWALPYAQQGPARLPVAAAPKALPAAAPASDSPGIISAEERWQHLTAQAQRYGAILHVAPELVLRDLKKTCGIREGTPPSFFAEHEWDCLTAKLTQAIRKRSVLDPAPRVAAVA